MVRVVKKMAKNTILDGIAASEHLDSSGEVLSIEGMDISSLGGPDSILNWEHNSKEKPTQVIGKVTFAKKIMKESDAKTKREKYFWNKTKKPMVYIKAELFDGVGHSGAQDVAAMLKYNNKDKGEDSRLVVGFSIEGGKMEKKGMVVTKSIARDVAITVKPCNKVCDAELIEDDVDEDFLYKNQEFDCEIMAKGEYLEKSRTYRSMILQDLKKRLPSMDNFNALSQKMKDTKSFKQKGAVADKIADAASKPMSLQPEAKPKRSKFDQKTPKGTKQPSLSDDKLKTGTQIKYDRNDARKKSGPPNWDAAFKNEKNNMRKALMAGMMGGTPDSKTGSAALAQEDLDPTLQKPFNSKAQRRFAYANPEKFGGKKGIKEWEEKTPKNIPEKVKKKVKKSEKLEKMSQPVFSNRDIGSEVDLRSDVKMVDPEKKYKMKSGKEVSQPELETKKIQNKYVQGEKEVSGAQKLSDFTNKGRKELEEYKQSFGSAIKPDEQKGVNVQDPDYKVNEAYEFKQKKPEGAKPDTSYPSTRHHEATHKFFSSVEQKLGKDVSTGLMDHILENFFDPKDLKTVNQNLSNYYDKDDPHLKEESLTHILDLIQDKNKRQDFHGRHSHMNSGELHPKKAEQLDRQRMNRLKRGYQNAVKFVNGLNSKQLKSLVKQRKTKR
jgi:hypothetical protein